MFRKELIYRIAKANNGIITSSLADEHGVLRGNLKYMSDKGLLEKVGRGVYVLPESGEDMLVTLQTRYKKGVFSGETALYLNGLLDEAPSRVCMTFSNSYNITSPKSNNVLCWRVKQEYYGSGIIRIKTPQGNFVNCYCAEKTLCELLNPRRNFDNERFEKAFSCYLSSPRKNFKLLFEFASLLRVEKRLKPYVENLKI